MIDTVSLTRAVKEKARALGFHLVGVTTPDPPPHLDVYTRWLEAGHHAEMGWMGTARARERRADPKIILPACKSILVLGIRYPTPPVSPPFTGGAEGRIASYAWGDDYHDVLPPRLKEVVGFIEELVGEPIPNRWYTDTGPILERELAQRAGLGWIGKNSCVINPKQGSYFLLAEILLGIELEMSDPFTADHCGTCTRCIDQCPTSCILPNRTIDANRCISYLTIEQKGFIPIDLRSELQNWIFGCDVCQQVCPWNQKFAVSSHDLAFTARPGVTPHDLAGELSLTPQEFNRKFRGSPVKRTKRRGYLRNVAVASGNLKHAGVIPALKESLTDAEPLIRGHAAWALGQIGGKNAQQALIDAGEVESDPEVKTEIDEALLLIKNSME